jgi:hypothetical protein
MTDISNQTIHTKEAIQPIEVVKRPRGRPKKEKEVQPKEKRPQGRPRKNKPPKEPQPRGRPRIYEVGTILKPKDPDYFKKYYENVVKEKRNARRLIPLEVPSEVPLE